MRSLKYIGLLRATQDDPDYPGMTLRLIGEELQASPNRRSKIRRAMDRLLTSGYVEWREHNAKKHDSNCFVNFSLSEKGEQALKQQDLASD